MLGMDDVATNREHPTHEEVKHIIDPRWLIEVYHLEIKKTCGIERCQSRTGRAPRNHIFITITAWFEKHKRRIQYQITLDLLRN